MQENTLYFCSQRDSKKGWFECCSEGNLSQGELQAIPLEVILFIAQNERFWGKYSSCSGSLHIISSIYSADACLGKHFVGCFESSNKRSEGVLVGRSGLSLSFKSYIGQNSHNINHVGGGSCAVVNQWLNRRQTVFKIFYLSLSLGSFY